MARYPQQNIRARASRWWSKASRSTRPRLTTTRPSAFVQEARVTASLRHAHTVRVVDFGQVENGALFLAMEPLYVPTTKQFLRDHNARGAVLTEAETIGIAIPVLRAQAEVHAAELVHRDLKPANIMLAEVSHDDQRVKRLDFGIARTED